jgi:hypothetical protein
VTQAEAQDRAITAWSDRLFERAPVAPIWVGLGLAAGLLALFVLLAWVSGGLAQFMEAEESLLELRDARIGVMIVFGVAYLLTARRYAALGARTDFEALRELLGWRQPRFEKARREFETLDPRRARIAGALGMLAFPITLLLIDRDPTLYLNAWYWTSEKALTWIFGLAFLWNLAVFAYATYAYARRLSDLASSLKNLELGDTESLAPFGRQGLRSALLWLILLSLFSVNVVDPGFVGPLAVVAVVTLSAATTALLLPSRGIHRRIDEMKRSELRRVDAAIRGETAALTESAIAPRARTATLADLVAYRGYVDAVHEWPFDTSTWVRFGLYLAIPLGSWLGGAFVERFLTAALD